MVWNILAMICGVVGVIVATASLARARLVRYRFACLSRELAPRWRGLDHAQKLNVLRTLGVSTLRRVPAQVLDGLYASILVGARASLREDCDLAELEIHLRTAFARHQGDGRSRAAVV
jgi:hypothetical protein